MYVHPRSDRLPHEPLRVRRSAPAFMLELLAQALLTAALGLLTAPLWPLLLLGALIWGWPPHQPRLWQVRRYARLIATERAPEPGIAPLSRLYLGVVLAQRVARIPLLGLAWHLDELLYGRRLADTAIQAPVFLLSAARSGSTQISRYLEEDPRLCAPTVLQMLMPYLWLWRLAERLAPLVSRERIDALLAAQFTEAFIQRHELSAFHTDTFEVLFFAQHLNQLAGCLGPEVFVEDFGFSSRAPHNRQLWEQDFVDYVDRLGRKVLRYADSDVPQRLYIKGHFQSADDALAARYPDAHFITVVRDPVSRLRSAINHLHGNSACEPLGSAPWAWLAKSVTAFEQDYCLRELRWFTRPREVQRSVIRFTDYVEDLQGAMLEVYGRVLGDVELPPHVPTEHAPRERRRYRVNRSLDELGIDVDAFVAPLAEYRAWCRSELQEAAAQGAS